MKTLLLVIALFISLAAQAQAPVQNLYAIGGSYNINARPSVAGTALYAHYVAGPGTYAFAAIDALPGTIKPFAVTSNVGAGVAQKLFSVGRVGLYLPTAAGISWTGANTGWQWSGGAAVTVRLKGSFGVMPTVRFLKSSVSGGSGYQPVIGLLFSFGK
jgi:hypothetical protein